MPAASVVGPAVATAPGAGATVASIAAGSLPAGRYKVTVSCGVSGNAVADLNNMKLQRGGADLVTPLPDGASGNHADMTLERVDLDGTQALAVLAIGAGTASIEYSATIVASRLDTHN